MSWYLPPGCPAPRRATEYFVCKNPDCEQEAWPVEGEHELGTFTADDDAECNCPYCGQEGE